MYDTDSPSSTVGILDSVCLAAFVTELFLRVGSCGWWSGPEAILRHPWSLLDVYLVACHGLTTTATVSPIVSADAFRCPIIGTRMPNSGWKDMCVCGRNAGQHFFTGRGHVVVFSGGRRLEDPPMRALGGAKDSLVRISGSVIDVIT